MCDNNNYTLFFGKNLTLDTLIIIFDPPPPLDFDMFCKIEDGYPKVNYLALA